MLFFKVYSHPEADKFLNNLDSATKERIEKRLRELNTKPNKKGKPHAPPFRIIRIGEYRAIYEITWNESKVNVLFIGHRTQVYDDFERIFL